MSTVLLSQQMNDATIAPILTLVCVISLIVFLIQREIIGRSKQTRGMQATLRVTILPFLVIFITLIIEQIIATL